MFASVTRRPERHADNAAVVTEFDLGSARRSTSHVVDATRAHATLMAACPNESEWERATSFAHVYIKHVYTCRYTHIGRRKKPEKLANGGWSIFVAAGKVLLNIYVLRLKSIFLPQPPNCAVKLLFLILYEICNMSESSSCWAIENENIIWSEFVNNYFLLKKISLLTFNIILWDARINVHRRYKNNIEMKRNRHKLRFNFMRLVQQIKHIFCYRPHLYPLLILLWTNLL